MLEFRYDTQLLIEGENLDEEHNQINGPPTILTINLYHSKWSFRNGYEPFYSTTINYN